MDWSDMPVACELRKKIRSMDCRLMMMDHTTTRFFDLYIQPTFWANGNRRHHFRN